MPTQSSLSEPALGRSAHAAQAGNEAARDLATYFVGQIVGSLNEVRPTRQVVFDMIDELIDATNALQQKLAAE